MEENLIKVYVKLDNNNVIIDINSSIFIQDLTGYVQIEEGNGDKYAHASGNYLEKGLKTDGKYNYKLVDGKVVELTDNEKSTLFLTVSIIEPPTNAELQTQIFNLTTQLVNGGVI